MATLVEGLKSQDARLDGLESEMDAKIDAFKESLLFNELNDIQEKLDSLEAVNLILQRRIMSDRLISLEEQVTIYLHTYNHAQSLRQNDGQLCLREVQSIISRVKGRLDNSTTPGTEASNIESNINKSLEAHGFNPIRWT